MGPLYPQELLSGEYNLLIGFLIGIGFGFALEASGFANTRKLAGVFYGYDFAVLKVFFTSAVVAVIGLYYMDYLNFVDISQLYVQPTYLWAAVIGGMIMGVGFLAGGFCPGTSLCAVAIGKIDGMVFTVGLMIGILIFSESFSTLEPFFESSNLGHITLVDTFSMSPYWIILIITIIAVVAFAFSDWVRSKIKKVFY